MIHKNNCISKLHENISFALYHFCIQHLKLYAISKRNIAHEADVPNLMLACEKNNNERHIYDVSSSYLWHTIETDFEPFEGIIHVPSSVFIHMLQAARECNPLSKIILDAFESISNVIAQQTDCEILSQKQSDDFEDSDEYDALVNHLTSNVIENFLKL